MLILREQGGVQSCTPQFFLNNSGSLWEFRDALQPILLKSQSARFGGSPINKFPVVTFPSLE